MSSTNDTYLAYSRFGLGPRPGDSGRLAGSARAALAAEIADPAALLLEDATLPDSVAAFMQVRELQMARKLLREQAMPAAPADSAAAAPPAPPASMDAGMQGEVVPGMAPAQPAVAASGKVSVPGVMAPQDLMLAEIAARLERVKAAEIGFGERLVAFWANHFAVQANVNEVVRGLAGAFEREAIRPHVLGRFADMLRSVTQHPAMLVSLNNATSIGPGSPQGVRSGKGLNENHARELMELHTVGVDAGYTQADVTSLARVLTGWTFGQNPKQAEEFGRFVFHKQAHEPGPQTVMGKAYAQAGVEQGEAVLADLAASPATAKHIALKLARHFIADVPDPAVVAQLAETFVRTRGDLKAVTLALIDAPAAWAAPAAKLRTPQEFLWSSVRALGLDLKPGFVVRSLADLGQPLWTPPSPEGFKDDAATWLAPDAMTTRVDTAELMAGQAKSIGDPGQLAADLFGSALSDDTRTAIDRAESRGQALALLLMSPEFQRR